MFTYWWYRYIRFRQEFEKDNGVDIFAEYYMASNLGHIKDKGDKIRNRIRRISSERSKWIDTRDRLAERGYLLGDADFPAVAAKYRRLLMLLILIGVGESGLNLFTAMIAIPSAGVLAGLAGDIVRLVVAVIVTVLGIVAAEIFLQEALPADKPRGPDSNQPPFNARWPKVILWGGVLIGIEWMIYHFGWARVADIEGGHVNPDVAKSIIALSMIVPLVGGGIAWELAAIHSPYKNRLQHDKCARLIDEADTTIEALRETENGYFQEKTNDHWYTYTRLRSFKEYHNSKVGVGTAPLPATVQYAAEYDTFYAETLKRYSHHKERQDALGVKLGDANAGIVGYKLGQDHVATAN